MAARVVYSSEQLLEKNKDFVVAEHGALLGSSASDFVRCGFKAEGLLRVREVRASMLRAGGVVYLLPLCILL